LFIIQAILMVLGTIAAVSLGREYFPKAKTTERILIVVGIGTLLVLCVFLILLVRFAILEDYAEGNKYLSPPLTHNCNINNIRQQG
jgi:cell division protein FtsX